MKVITLPQARQAIRMTALHIKQDFGRMSRDNFLAKVNEARMLLADNPYLGPVEPLLADRTQTYRSVVVGRLNKMVYYVEDDDKIIYVVAFWDCREEPATLARQVK